MEPLGLVVHGKAEPFSEALRSLVNNPRYSDVCFVVGQERQEVFAHRCLLACRCNFFQRLLGTEPGPGVPSPVVLSTVPTEAFLAVLEFLYTNSVKLHRHSVSPLTRVLGGTGGGCQRQEFAHYTVGRGQGKLPSTPPTTHSTGARSADSGCGIWAGGTERGGRNLRSGAAAGALRGFHRGPQPGTAPFILLTPRTAFCSSLTHLPACRRPSGPKASWSCQRPRCCPCSAATSSAWTRLNWSARPGVGRAWARRSRLWRRGNAMPCGEGMRPGAPRVAAGEAPCPGSITAFWTYPLNDPTPGLTGSLGPAQLSLPQTTAPEVLGVRSGLPFPACPVSRAPEEPLSATRSLLCGVKPEWARWVGAGSGRAWAGPPCVGETRKRGFPSLHALTLRPAPGGIVVY
nr:BTB/POZ domain-containing protein 19 isoform X2 [Chlorocebus sabaeus]